MPLYAIGDKRPTIAPSAWIAPTAILIGDVRVAPGASVWWGVVIRADNAPIIIGENSNVQDGSVLHTDPGLPLEIGHHVTIGHMVMLHGCRIDDHALIGIKSVVLNRAHIGAYALVGANSLVPENKEIPPRVMALGSPCKVVRTLEERDIDLLDQLAPIYVRHQHNYAENLHLLEE
ncbi:MAG: gamma carbonic anhydrase family protein [Proteobacteria bacterium]|nr:gamma carbonic anhydrase family protein [Pseudomonadota bacterium]HQR03369.1 gamma carbonic anhydrase family protein [Rhodocyclaceae bacterium]